MLDTSLSTSSTSVLPPPSYSPSSASPAYAVEPQEGESRLELVTRTRPAPPSATFTTTTRGITVTFHEQDPGVSAPTYARNAIIRGDIQLSEEVLSVSIKLEGRQTLSVSDTSSMEHVLFSEEHVLWHKRDGSSAGCPSRHPFLVPFPLNYTAGASSFLNPPTCDIRHTGSLGLCARISYGLTITARKAVVGSWKKHKSVSIPILYHPRSRPYLPISSTLYPFLSTLKTRPEDWHQITTTVPTKRELQSAIDCHLFIPSVQIYALTDTIPFHLQLKGPSDTLRKYMGLSSVSSTLPTRVSTRSSQTSHASSTSHSSSSSLRSAVRTAGSLLGTLSDALLSAHTAQALQKASIRVYVLRQTSVQVHGHKMWKDVIIGEGTLRPIEHPPKWSWTLGQQERDEEEEEAMDWEGEVKVNEGVKMPSLAAGDLRVKDFIVLNLRPANPESSSFAMHQHVHPIRLVTDPYLDTYSHPSDD